MNSDRKLLATINVYEFENPTGSRSHQSGPTSFEVEVAPQKDKELFAREGINADSSSIRSRQTLLAHELGHVVAQIYKDPTHDEGLNLVANLLGDGRIKVPGERLAWHNAEKMVPDLDKEIEQKAIESYTEG